jgi:cytochrome oxidase Cu insertion factor (SCO1/SenC/PrrC family)
MRGTLLFSLLLLCQMMNAQPSPMIEKDKVVITTEIPPGFIKKSIQLGGYPAPSVTIKSEEEFTIEKPVHEPERLRWEIPGDRPFFIYGEFIHVPKNILNYLVEPGDNISIDYDGNGKLNFSGAGAGKFELITKLIISIDSLKKQPYYQSLSPLYSTLFSLEDYQRWNRCFDDQLAVTLSLIDEYKKDISEFAYNVIKESVVSTIETGRLGKFKALCMNTEAPSKHSGLNQFGLSNKDLCHIYDSTQNGPAVKWLEFETKFVSQAYYYYLRSTTEAYREKGKFFKENQSDSSIIAADKVDNYVYRYNIVKKRYKGIVREATLAFFFHYPGGMLKLGFPSKIENLLKDYYSLSQFQEYARAVKSYELKLREIKTGLRDYDYSLTGVNDERINKASLNGKMTLIDFWFTGCIGCVQMVPVLKKIEEYFKDNNGIQFVNVSIDKEKSQWKQSLLKKKYTTAGGISAYTGGEGSNHSLIKNYLINSYPSLLLFDPYGRIILSSEYTDPRKDEGRSLIGLIEKRIDLMNDGPYVYYKRKDSIVFRFFGNRIDSLRLTPSTYINVPVSRDSSFSFPLKKKMEVEPSTYPMPEKILAISDIEGNFPALKQLLVTNGVINNEFKWTFGKGHLVFTGDMFDRGEQVTECLWLLYSLEEQAIRQGGYVHFILGNHEIMNLQGDNRYTQIKYKKNSAHLNMNLKELFDENSELGRWLRTKNIIEKVGDLLFVHGGVSSAINSMKLTPKELNSLARPYYSSYLPNKASKNIRSIMNDNTGLFWYREYYSLSASGIDPIIDETLKLFSVKHIITGHTVAAEGISAFFNGKVFNTDTKHREGKSEALLIEKGKFYAVDAYDKKRLLYTTHPSND